MQGGSVTGYWLVILHYVGAKILQTISEYQRKFSLQGRRFYNSGFLYVCFGMGSGRSHSIGSTTAQADDLPPIMVARQQVGQSGSWPEVIQQAAADPEKTTDPPDLIVAKLPSNSVQARVLLSARP
jgi:hypothetical protein